MDKIRLRDAVVEKIAAELELITRAALMSRDEATHEESKPENKYDMHAQEAAYLAEGQARLAAELNENLALFRGMPVAPWPPATPAGVGSLLKLEAKGKESYYLLGPRSGGLEVDVDGIAVTVITPGSPLGRQLLGASVGKAVQLPGRGGPQTHIVVSVL
jgi:transcription elongation GreA/GreB family factor